MDIHSLLMLLAAIAVVWIICAPCSQLKDSIPQESEKEGEVEEKVVEDMSIPY